MPDISLGNVPLGSTGLRAYEARPAGDGPWPGVVAIHEVWGMNEVLQRQCDRLAQAGFLSVGPDLFSDGGMRRCVTATMRSMLTGRGKAVADIEAARRHLLDQADCTGKVGVIGFCMGGGFALVLANRGYDAASANYGTVPRRAERALAGACPVIGSYGKRDLMMTGQAAKLEKSLTALGIEHDVKVYPDAGHSFLNHAESGPALLRPLERILHIGPEPEAAADAWQRIESFFDVHLR